MFSHNEKRYIQPILLKTLLFHIDKELSTSEVSQTLKDTKHGSAQDVMR